MKRDGETRRILPPATRGANRYRLYGDDAVEMLRFIKRATGLGLTLAEIRDILPVGEIGRPAPRSGCGRHRSITALEDTRIGPDVG